MKRSEISLEAGWSLSDAPPLINTTIDRERITLNEETRANEIWETSFVNDSICRSGKANRTQLRSIHHRVSSST